MDWLASGRQANTAVACRSEVCTGPSVVDLSVAATTNRVRQDGDRKAEVAVLCQRESALSSM